MNVYRGEHSVKNFAATLDGKKVLAVMECATKPLAKPLLQLLPEDTGCICFEEGFLPEIQRLLPLLAAARDVEYIIGIGSGTVNDVCKYASARCGVPYGIYATAPSMDGYASSISALYENGKKITLPTTVPQDIIVDVPLLREAPLDMIVAGAGDMIGKYTSLLDWKLAKLLKGEDYDADIVARMKQAAALCLEKAPLLVDRDSAAVEALMEGLILSGIEMQNAGNSRPASGSEHHISHYLEMAAERENTYFAPHGVQVALGSLAANMMYRFAAELPELAPIAEDIKALPSLERLEGLYAQIGLPTRFSEIGVSKALLTETLQNAYTVRERYTVMTFLHDKGILPKITPSIADTLF